MMAQLAAQEQPASWHRHCSWRGDWLSDCNGIPPTAISAPSSLRSVTEIDSTLPSASRGDWNTIFRVADERAYPDFDCVRTGQIEIEDQRVSGLRRSWRDGKRQRLELMTEEVAGGLVAYLAGLKERR